MQHVLGLSAHATGRNGVSALRFRADESDSRPALAQVISSQDTGRCALRPASHDDVGLRPQAQRGYLIFGRGSGCGTLQVGSDRSPYHRDQTAADAVEEACEDPGVHDVLLGSWFSTPDGSGVCSSEQLQLWSLGSGDTIITRVEIRHHPPSESTGRHRAASTGGRGIWGARLSPDGRVRARTVAARAR